MIAVLGRNNLYGKAVTEKEKQHHYGENDQVKLQRKADV